MSDALRFDPARFEAAEAARAAGRPLTPSQEFLLQAADEAKAEQDALLAELLPGLSPEEVARAISLAVPRAAQLRDHILRLARPLFAEHGPGLTMTRFCALANVRERQLYGAFETFGQLREAVGLPAAVPPKAPGRTAESLLEAARALAAEGRPATLQEFCLREGVSEQTVARRWGNWTRLAAAAGLATRPAGRPPASGGEVLADVARVGRRLGRPPKKTEYGRLGRRGVTAPYQRFGAWKTVLSLAARAEEPAEEGEPEAVAEARAILAAEQ